MDAVWGFFRGDYLFQLMHAWLQVARARSSTPSSTM
ncbi:hypothetical protein AZ54_13120 [Xanthomonas oryzae pv. oryzae PXO86]|nr:hypothetical protein AZ54_13120 [Xanthomonas oryzae pv. oryzae PXO86]